MKIGIVGYQGSGKSSLFQWLTGVLPDQALKHTTQTAAAVVDDDRLKQLAELYRPKKVTHASIVLADTPGLSPRHEGNAARLAQIREAGCLAVVIAAFGGKDAESQLRVLDEDLLLADWSVLLGRIDRLRESIKKPKPTRQQEQAELEGLIPLAEHLETGQPLRLFRMSAEQARAIKSFQLLTEKPRVVIVNVSDDVAPGQHMAGDGSPLVSVPLRLQLQLSQLSESERGEFCREMEIEFFDRSALIKLLMHQSGQMLFFTVGEKECRSWLIPPKATAEEAAATIHTDLARNFVRAEQMTVEDLLRLGSERAVKAHNLMVRQPRDYVVQEGDILHILASS